MRKSWADGAAAVASAAAWLVHGGEEIKLDLKLDHLVMHSRGAQGKSRKVGMK